MYLQNNRLQVLVLHVNHFIWTVTDYSFTALNFLRLQLGATTAQVQSNQMLRKSENVKKTLNKIRASDTSARYIFNRAKVHDGQSSLVVFGHPMVLESFNVCLVSLSCYSVTPSPWSFKQKVEHVSECIKHMVIVAACKVWTCIQSPKQFVYQAINTFIPAVTWESMRIDSLPLLDCEGTAGFGVSVLALLFSPHLTGME